MGTSVFIYCKLEITDFAIYTIVLHLSIIFNTIIVIGLSKKRLSLLIKNLLGGIKDGEALPSQSFSIASNATIQEASLDALQKITF